VHRSFPTNDPTGAYNLYAYSFGTNLNDYPKFGVCHSTNSATWHVQPLRGVDPLSARRFVHMTRGDAERRGESGFDLLHHHQRRSFLPPTWMARRCRRWLAVSS